MGISPAMASTPRDGDVLKAPTIHKAALLCILFKIFKRYNKKALL